MREDHFGGVAAREELNGHFRFGAAGMDCGPSGVSLVHDQENANLLGRFYQAIDTLSPVGLTLGRITNLHLVSPARLNVLLMMDDRVCRRVHCSSWSRWAHAAKTSSRGAANVRRTSRVNSGACFAVAISSSPRLPW